MHHTSNSNQSNSLYGRSAHQAQRLIRVGNVLRTRITGVAGRVAASRVGDVFSVDLRSLAVFRIFLGLLVIADLAGRVPNFRAHFTDDGILPRELLMTSMSEWRWSLFLVNSSVQFQVALFIVTWVAAILMIVGFRTRLMLFIVWVMIMSLQVRNPMVLSGADTLLRLTLFWAMLLPLGAVWSIDSRRADPERRPTTTRFVSMASAGLMIQIAIMYWFTAILKSGDSWRTDGTALFYATGAGQLNRPVGEYLHQFPHLLRVMTHVGYGIECLAPLLLFIPFRRGFFRIASILAIVSLHFGIFLIMDVALFPWTSSLVMAAFLPDSFWAFSALRYRRTMRWLEGRLSRPQLRRSLPGLPSLSPALSGVQPKDFASREQASMSTSRALVQRLVSSLRERNEHSTDIDPAESHPSPSVRSSWMLNAFAAFCIVFVMIWNIPSVSAFRMPSESVPVAYGLGLYQKWNMFAPNPPNATVWYVVRGFTDGGEAVDLVTPFVYDDIETARAFTWDEPDNIVSGYYKDKYWRKYFSAIALDNYDDERMQFARYACRSWNSYYGGTARLDRLQMIMVKRPILLDGGDGKEQRKLIDQYSCA